MNGIISFLVFRPMNGLTWSSNREDVVCRFAMPNTKDVVLDFQALLEVFLAFGRFLQIDADRAEMVESPGNV